MISCRYLLLAGTFAYFAWYLPCRRCPKNYESANQLTVVQGTVTSYANRSAAARRSLMAIVSFENGFSEAE